MSKIKIVVININTTYSTVGETKYLDLYEIGFQNCDKVFSNLTDSAGLRDSCPAFTFGTVLHDNALKVRKQAETNLIFVSDGPC